MHTQVGSMPPSTWHVFLTLYMQYTCAAQWTYIAAHCTTLRYITSHYATVDCCGIASEIHTCMRSERRNVFVQLCILFFLMTFSVTFVCIIQGTLYNLQNHVPHTLSWSNLDKTSCGFLPGRPGDQSLCEVVPSRSPALSPSAWGNLPLEIL